MPDLATLLATRASQADDVDSKLSDLVASLEAFATTFRRLAIRPLPKATPGKLEAGCAR